MTAHSPSGPGWLGVLIALAATCSSACVVPNLLEDRPCPCAAGWSCEPTRQVCVRGSLDAAPDSGLTDAGLTDAGLTDAGLTDAAPTDAGLTPIVPTTCWLDAGGCDWSAPAGFDFVVDDGAALSNLALDGNALFTPDACSLYYASNGDMFIAARPSSSSAFGLGQSVGEINTAADEVRATEGPRALELLFGRSGDFGQIFRTRRSAPGEDWGAATLADALNAAGQDSFDVALAPHGLDVYLTRISGSEAKVYTARRASLDDEFGPAALLADISAPGSVDAEASVTADDRVIAFISARDGGAERHAYYATRSGPGASWGTPRLVPGPFLELDLEDEVSVSPDGCELLVNRPAGFTRLTYRAR